MKKLFLTLVLFLILFAGCADDNTGVVSGLPVRLEIAVKALNKVSGEYSAVPEAVIELLTLSRSYINGQRFRQITGNSGVVIFETDSNVLCANKTYLLVGSHPTNKILLDTEQEFTMPQLPNLGNQFVISKDFIFERID